MDSRPSPPENLRRVGGWPTLSQLPFVVPTNPGTPARMIPLDHSAESCPILCGCPILRRFCEGWVFLVLVLVSVSVSLLLPRFPSNPSTHPVCTNPLPHTDKTGNYSRPSCFVRLPNRSKSTPSHPSQTQRRMGHPQGPRLNFGVNYWSGIILTEAPSILETTNTKLRGAGHPPKKSGPLAP